VKVSVEGDLAAGRLPLAAQQVEQGGLAHAIAADQPDPLAPELQVDAAEHRAPSGEAQPRAEAVIDGMAYPLNSTDTCY
jgi:hypothetical protein